MPAQRRVEREREGKNKRQIFDIATQKKKARQSIFQNNEVLWRKQGGLSN